LKKPKFSLFRINLGFSKLNFLKMTSRDLSTDSIAPSDSISSFNTIPTVIDLAEESPRPTAVRKATCWYFFHYPTDPTTKRVKCYYCKDLVTFNKSSSTNLTAHAKKHHKLYAKFDNNTSKIVGESTQKEIGVQKIPSYDINKSQDLLVQWILSDSQAFRVAENPFFQAFVQSLYFDYNALKKDAVSQRVMKLFDIVKVKITEMLSEHPGKFSITLDIWTSPSQNPFLCVTLHFIDGSWELKSQVIAFRYIPGNHSGIKISSVLLDVLKEYQLEDRILTVTVDNASNNNTLVTELIEMGTICDGEHHIRCFAHIVNLAAQDLIFEFNDKLASLREIITSIRYSNLKIDRLKEKCNFLSKKFSKPMLDVKTRWNSTYDMIVRALELKQPLSLLLDDLSLEDSDFPLLENSDWDFFTELTLLLKPFKEVTEMISGQFYSTFNTVLPSYNFLMDHCVDFQNRYSNWREGTERIPYRAINDTSEILIDLIRASAAANSKFDKYYNVQSDFAIAALVLDPRLNTSYYEYETQQESAKNEVMHYFEKFYKPTNQGTETLPDNPTLPSSSASVRGSIYKKRKLVVNDGQSCEVL
jgi:hypothetical protein